MANEGLQYDRTGEAIEGALLKTRSEGIRFEIAIMALCDLMMDLSFKNDPSGAVARFVADRVFESIRNNRVKEGLGPVC